MSAENLFTTAEHPAVPNVSPNRLPAQLSAVLSRFATLSALRYLTGVVVVCFGASLGILSGAGAAPYDAFLVTLVERFAVPYWVVAWGMQLVFIAALLRLHRRPKPSQIAHSLMFGPVITAMLEVLPAAPSAAWSAVYVAAAVPILAVGIWLYLGAGFFQGLLDSVFESASVRFRVPSTSLRLAFDVAVLAYAWMGYGPVGWGTVVIAFGVAPLLSVLNSRGLSVPSSWRGIGLRSRIVSAARQRSARSRARRLDHFADPTSLHPPSRTLLR